MAEETSGGSLGLQFDRAVPRGGSLPDASGVVTCHACQRTMHAEYYDVSGHATCAECRARIDTLLQTPQGMGPLVKAGLFGLGAGIAGAAIYYAVLAIAHLEIGIVAILIGYMVGYAVRKGAGGRGGRRFQVMAVALTYVAVALAYTPIAVTEALKHRSDAEVSVTADKGAAPSPDSAGESQPAGSPFTALAMLAGLIVALPILVIVGSMPSGLISAAIIFFGMQQAWRMTGTPALQITGPYKVGAPPAATA